MNQNALPINRKSQLKQLIVYRWKSLLIIGGILLIFAIPLFASFLLKDLKAISIVTTSDTSDLSLLFLNDLFYAIFIVPSIAIFFIGLSGIYRIVRNYIWAEGVILKSDFFIGIKQNWMHFAISGLIFALIYYGSYLAILYIDVPMLKYLPLALSVVLIYPVILVHMNLTVIYKNSYLAQFKNAFLLYVKKFYIYLLFFIVLIIIPFIFMVCPVPLIIKYVILFLFIYLFIPFFVLIISVFSMYVFDENINKERHPDLYKKGLF